MTSTGIRRKPLLAIATSLLVAAALAGCTESPGFSSSASTGYVSGSGQYDEIKVADRKPALAFTTTLDTGAKLKSSSLLGKVHIVNFWYAGCGPCRVEAPLLESVYKSYKGKIPFLGVNTYDTAATARTFEQTHNVTYASAIDITTASVQYAYSAYVSPDAVPVTLVIDRHGRVAARITGELESASILTSLIKTVVSEGQ
jgi:thiol-disulfide isomerase/thioredoxin